MNKYGAKKTVVDGITFDSKHEASRYVELKCLERAGLIKGLQLQEGFELVPPIKGENGKVIQRSVSYIADFCYWERKGTGWEMVVEDAKSPATRTAVYLLKKKLMLWRHGITVKES